MQSIANALSQQSACWSCQIYSNIFTGLRKMVDQSYAYFVGSSSGALVLATTILAIAVLFKIMPIVMGTQDPTRVGAEFRLFLVRVTMVFTLFLGTTVVSSSGSFLSDWFVDGPLALGTALGTELAQATASSSVLGGTNPFGTNLGSSSGSGGTPTLNPQSSDEETGLQDVEQTTDQNGAALTNQTTPAARTMSNTGTGSVDLGTQHVQAAQAMLFQLHLAGVSGIITGIWLAVEGPTLIGQNFITNMAIRLAGVALAFSFFMFTVTFGLRYIDALIRSMIIFALSPLFAFLYIFDSTREIALKSLKAGLSLAAVFAVSGVVFTIALIIMKIGFTKAFSMGGQGISTASLQNVLQQIQGGGFAFITGNSGSSSGTLNWLSYALLLASSMLGIAIAKLSFEIASHMFSFGRAEMGLGREVEGEISGAAQQLKGAGANLVGRR